MMERVIGACAQRVSGLLLSISTIVNSPLLSLSVDSIGVYGDPTEELMEQSQQSSVPCTEDSLNKV